MARIQLQNEETDNPEIQRIFKEIKSRAGQVPAAYRAFARLPHVLQANWNRTVNILSKGDIPIQMKETIATAVSAANGCHFCLAIHKANLKKQGVTDAEIANIEKGSSDDPKTDFVIKFVIKATKNPEKITDEEFDRLKKFGFSEEDIVEILTVMEMYTGYNKFIVALDLKLDD